MVKKIILIVLCISQGAVASLVITKNVAALTNVGVRCIAQMCDDANVVMTELGHPKLLSTLYNNAQIIELANTIHLLEKSIQCKKSIEQVNKEVALQMIFDVSWSETLQLLFKFKQLELAKSQQNSCSHLHVELQKALKKSVVDFLLTTQRQKVRLDELLDSAEKSEHDRLHRQAIKYGKKLTDENRSYLEELSKFSATML